MSTTAQKRPIEQARADAEALREYFSGHFDRWTIAGSVRRGKPMVGDVEHVVIAGPKFLARMDELTYNPDDLFAAEHVPFRKAEYQDGTHRWGELYRGLEFNLFKHEVFIATPDNWGSILAIRTGPAEFSQRLVTQMKAGGVYRQQGGYVVYQSSGERITCPDEQTFFTFCREPWREPKDRQ